MTDTRIDQLDGLRALAALAVLAFHVRLPGFHGGFIGVDVFFVLSGFLITRLLRTEAAASGRIDIRLFAAKRAIRLFPALLLSVAAIAFVLPSQFPKANPWAESLIPLLYVSDYARAFYRAPDVMQHTWSLSVETHFYMVWPLVILFFRNVSDRSFATARVALFLVSTIWRIFVFNSSEHWERTYYSFDTRLSGLVIGSALAAIAWRPNPRNADAVAVIAAVVLAICTASLKLGKVAAVSWGGVSVDLASAFLILSLLTPRTQAARALSWPPLARIGLWSYALYLWHYPIARLARIEMMPVTAFAVTLVASLILSAATYEFFERPLQRWLRNRIPLPAPAHPSSETSTSIR